VTSTTAGTVKSSFSAAMEIDLGRQEAQARPDSVSMSAPPPAPPAIQAPSTPKQPLAKAPIIEEPESESEEEYGYNSGDEEGLQVCTDVAVSP
jgi:hypothetical protein